MIMNVKNADNGEAIWVIVLLAALDAASLVVALMAFGNL
jgi:hypothetical protein